MNKETKTSKVIITKDNIIRQIARQTNYRVDDVKVVYNTFEEIIFNHLCSVDENQDVCMKLFEGINLNGKYVAEKVKQNNLTGKEVSVESKIVPKFYITRPYKEKVNKK